MNCSHSLVGLEVQQADMKPVRPWLVEPCRWQADLEGGANAGCHPAWAVAATVHLRPLEAVCLQHL